MSASTCPTADDVTSSNYVDDQEAFYYGRLLARLEGLLSGICSGAALAATIAIGKRDISWWVRCRASEAISYFTLARGARRPLSSREEKLRRLKDLLTYRATYAVSPLRKRTSPFIWRRRGGLGPLRHIRIVNSSLGAGCFNRFFAAR